MSNQRKNKTRYYGLGALSLLAFFVAVFAAFALAAGDDDTDPVIFALALFIALLISYGARKLR